MEDEAVLVAEEMVLTKVVANSAPWPSQRFWVAEKAKSIIKKTSGYKDDGSNYISLYLA
jgi:hypothetical protein